MSVAGLRLNPAGETMSPPTLPPFVRFVWETSRFPYTPSTRSSG